MYASKFPIIKLVGIELKQSAPLPRFPLLLWVPICTIPYYLYEQNIMQWREMFLYNIYCMFFTLLWMVNCIYKSVETQRTINRIQFRQTSDNIALTLILRIYILIILYATINKEFIAKYVDPLKFMMLNVKWLVLVSDE